MLFIARRSRGNISDLETLTFKEADGSISCFPPSDLTTRTKKTHFDHSSSKIQCPQKHLLHLASAGMSIRGRALFQNISWKIWLHVILGLQNEFSKLMQLQIPKLPKEGQHIIQKRSMPFP